MPLPPSPPRQQQLLPIQYTPVQRIDLVDSAGRLRDSGLSALNQTLSQLTTTLNSLLGAGGPTILPAGIDVAGSPLTGLPAPSGPTDAVSAAHVSTNYGAAAQSTALDLGGPNTLKGLAALQLWFNTGITATVTLAKLTVAGSNGSLTVTHGLITGYVAPS
jgi:hypothetical protein